eukprot:gb/GECG01010000.1/.p1 GENE.gb/GECG01010000.1/~~gb/GECG01010000.1/.p1  ORF type:complete len:147 (+),score=26.60 gb/GECG01010000.1/:1-441(+)
MSRANSRAQADDERARLLERSSSSFSALNGQNGSSSYSTQNSSGVNGGRNPNDAFFEDQQSLQQYHLQQQDSHLEALESSLSRISEMSKHISSEMTEQTRMIEETQEEVDETQSKMEYTTRQIQKFIQENGMVCLLACCVCMSRHH